MNSAHYSERINVLSQASITLEPLHPIGAAVRGVNLSSSAPPEEIRHALEVEMAHRGFLVFKESSELSVDAFIKASQWWGGRALHSTHGIHPATPQHNRHIFRLSNDERHGILGVGPQWHNDGSFNADVFSHSGYHIIRVAEQGGGTHFAHLSAAYNALSQQQKAYWETLVSVNATSGVLHPLVHEHPITGEKCVYLHLGMTGAIIARTADPETVSCFSEAFRLLEPDEMSALMNAYNDLLNDGFQAGYAIDYNYEPGDCVFIDNLTVAHRAAPEAHQPAAQQGLRIMHRTTVQAKDTLSPPFGLPQFLNIAGPNPFGRGVWLSGGIGFRWNVGIAMQN